MPEVVALVGVAATSLEVVSVVSASSAGVGLFVLLNAFLK